MTPARPGPPSSGPAGNPSITPKEKTVTTDLYAMHRDHARALVVAEIEDVLTRTADGKPAPQWADTAKAITKLHPADQLSVLVETAAIAGEAVIRLAATRSEDPRATWQWLLATEWTGADHDPATP